MIGSLFYYSCLHFTAVFVIGPGDQGILYQHHEKVVGDAADLEQVKDAIMKVDMPTE